MQPDYQGWVEPLPNFNYNVRLLIKEYQKYVAERIIEMLADGSVYIVNNSMMHTFVNAGDEPRIHLTLKKLDTSKVNTGDVRIGDPGVDI